MWIELEDEASFANLHNLAIGAGVLSVYLPIRPETPLRQAYAAELLDILRAGRGASANADKGFDAESARVLDYVRNDYEPSGRTLAIFSSQPRDLFVTMRFQIAMPGLARFTDRPYLSPIEAAIEDHPRIAVAVVGQREARILTSFLERVASERRVTDDVPGRQRQGGWAAFRIEASRVAEVEDHYKHVARVLQETYEKQPFKRLVVGASPEVLSGLTDELSATVRPLLAGSFAPQMYANEHEIVAAGERIAEEAERSEEVALVDKIMDSAAAVVGWEPTLRALGEGRVHALALSAAQIGTPRADEALSKAWDTGATVEFVRGEADAKLATGEGIAALLRY